MPSFLTRPVEYDHGSKNEINAISTLVGKILPSLFPGIWYCEEGCIALKHDGEIFCVVSPDGSGRDPLEPLNHLAQWHC
jgi:hypothetical protein